MSGEENKTKPELCFYESSAQMLRWTAKLLGKLSWGSTTTEFNSHLNACLCSEDGFLGEIPALAEVFKRVRISFWSVRLVSELNA